MLPDLEWQRTAFLAVARQALFLEIRRCPFACRFNVRVVTTDTSQTVTTGSIALAQGHRIVVLEQVLMGWIFASGRDHQNCQSVIARSARTEIAHLLSEFQHANVASLVA